MPKNKSNEFLKNPQRVKIKPYIKNNILTSFAGGWKTTFASQVLDQRFTYEMSQRNKRQHTEEDKTYEKVLCGVCL